MTGEDPARLSAVFDEVTIKERLVVEGGKSNQVLSQFDGPVTFNGEVKSSNKVKITNDTDSTSTTSGALLVTGGIGVAKNLNIGGILDVDGTTNLDGLTIDGDLDLNGSADISLNLDVHGNLGVDGNVNATNGTFTGNGSFASGSVTVTSNTVTANSFDGVATRSNNVTGSGNRILFNNSTNTTTTSSNLQFNGTNLTVGGDIIAFSASDIRLKSNITSIADAINKVKSLRGVTFEWNENSEYEGPDTGVIAQEVDALELAGLVQQRQNGFLAVRYEKLIPVLIEAIKELSDKVDSLEQRLNN